MNARETKRGKQSVGVTAWLPVNQARILAEEAAAASMSLSAYAAAKLSDGEPEQYPALAALASVIAIHETVRASGGLTSDQLAELRAIMGEFAKLARAEASR